MKAMAMGMLASGLLLAAAGTRAWSAESEGEDSKLQKEIQGVFRKDPDLKNNRIAVTVDNCNTDEISTNCNVTLAGAVDNQAERMKAEQVARVKGVVLIDNLLDLRADATDGIADGAVTAKVRELLLADATFKNTIISITTTHGVVTLVGTVPSDQVRRLASEKVRQARAVKRVDNGLRVEAQREVGGRRLSEGGVPTTPPTPSNPSPSAPLSDSSI